MIEIENRGAIRWLTLSRPERKNAIPPDGWEQLAEAFAAFEASDARVLVVTGAGDAFCSGADLGGGGGDDPGERRARLKRVGDAALALHRLGKPTIAAVNGVAAGAGMNLALGCDVVVAGRSARFTEVFVRRGLTVDFGGTWLLPKMVGLQRAKELALSGRIVEADEAQSIGLCLEVVEDDALEARVDELAASFAAQAPVAQRFAKQNLNAGVGSSFEAALDREGNAQIICLGSADVAEGVSAFVEKRDPNFTGR